MGAQQWPLSKTYHGVGKTNTAPADSPYGSQFAPFYGPLTGEKVILHSMSEFLHSFPFHHCIDFFFLFKPKSRPHFVSTKCSQQNTFGLFLDS